MEYCKILEGVRPKLEKLVAEPSAVGLSGASELLEDLQVHFTGPVTHIHTRIHTYTHVHVHTHPHTYTHTHS